MTDLTKELQSIYKKYPALQRHGFEAGWGETSKYGGQLEFFHPDEPASPRPGTPYIEVYNKKLKGEHLERAIFGDALHFMPYADQGYANIKAKFVESITPEQWEFARRRYNYDREQHGEMRDFDKWFDVSFSDAMMRGYLAPDERDEWRKSGVYTDKQKYILDAAKAYLSQ